MSGSEAIAAEKRAVLAAVGDDHETAIAEFSRALSLGLSRASTVSAHAFLGSSYGCLLAEGREKRGEDLSDWIANEAFTACVGHFEKAAELDRTYETDFFSKPTSRAMLFRLDNLYMLEAMYLKEQGRPTAAIKYLKTKLELFDFIESPPLLKSLLHLGVLYMEESDHEGAAAAFRSILDAEPMGDPSEQQTRQYASDNLALLGSAAPVAETTSRDVGSTPTLSTAEAQPRETSSDPSGYRERRKQRGVALVLEVLPGLFGLLGFGWIYAGRTGVGLVCLAGYLAWLVGAGILSAFTAGFGCFFTLPITLVLLLSSAALLDSYTRRHPELFGS